MVNTRLSMAYLVLVARDCVPVTVVGWTVGVLVIILVGHGSSFIIVVEVQVFLVVVASAQNSSRYVSTFVSQTLLSVPQPA